MNQINTMEDLILRKENALREKDKKAIICKETWKTITSSKKDNGVKTPTQKILSHANNAAMVFDGAMFGWKLYKMLKSRKEPKKKKGFFSKFF